MTSGGQGDGMRQEKEKIRKKIRTAVDFENYEYYPGEKPPDFYDDTVHRRVAVYVRVSTADIHQTTSYELQKKYYEDYVVRHPNWTLEKIYADEGISGTSMAHRTAFQQMIRDCKAGKIDLVITKSVSRFARNVVLCIGTARDLAELDPPVGVFFESEGIFSLNDESRAALSFQATMADEESRIKSRSMETSLRMRLDNGLPLTPKLLGYRHDSEGNLVINPDEAPTVKLAFYMYLYGCSTQQIADSFNRLGRRSYLGNVKWTSGGIVQILRNERHCGDVLTRKTYTPTYLTHLAKKNRGQRPQSRYFNHHEAIVSRDDFNAVQQMLDNAKYGNKSILSELRVIDSGKLRGFVIINPRWAGYDGLPFSVPKSLYLIGMMNTADRSLAMIDYALRRRFSFFEMEPGFDSDGFSLYQASLDNETLNEIIDRVKDLNKEIAADKSLGKGFCIGHSYFCGQDTCTDEWLDSVVNYDILPMLSEYWFDDPARLQRWENILRGVLQ